MTRSFRSVLLSVLLILLLTCMVLPAAADSFDSTVTITEDTDQITVEVSGDAENDSIFADKKPTLTVPCNFAAAKVLYGTQPVEGAVLDTSKETITFPVTKSGTYIIQKQAVYTVSFHTGTTAAIAQQTVSQGGTVTKPADPSKDNFVFDGWYADEALTTPWDFENDTVSANTTLYAKWAAAVTFNSNGGSAVDTQTVTPGSTLTKPTDPTLANCTFAGWYADEALTTAWDFENDTVSANTTLYAKWTAVVTFNSNGGSTVASQTVAQGAKLTKPTDPTKENYAFVGWYQNHSCTISWDFDNDTVTSNTTLHAKWVRVFTVTFNSNGGSAVDSQHIKRGETVEEPAEPTLANCTFAGWYRDEQLKNSWIFSSNTVTADTTLYAKWTAAVTFNSNGGSAVDTQTVTPGSTLTKPTDPTLANCTFAGWYKDADFTAAWDFDKDTVSVNTTLYAKWTAVVTFNSNDGSTVASVTVTKGAKLAKPTDPTKENYVFSGWFKEEALTTEWNFETDTVTANTTLYAKWLDAVTVTFNSNGGSTVASQTVAQGATLTKPTDPTKQNYFFDGWYKESSLTTKWIFETNTVTTDITLYAKWDNYTFKSTSYSWSKNSNRTLTIKIVDEGQADLLESIIINGSVVDPKYYEVTADGNTISIKLKPGCLQNLPIKNGYQLIAKFQNGGIAETKLNILKSSGNASTGDMFRIGLWITLLVGSVAGVAALLIFKKRKK